ncbi:UNVERIFIED_CONTAM: hypothetical protein PYX00_001139 [Menopon gallinae]|uniref:Deoxyribonuclease TATDN1 n=1 Tax=Menopon gallinae TaxID=328185 RepID=A0AAW2IBS2_9NEOP
MNKKVLHFIDIGANLVDSMYSGIYNGNQKHAPDLKAVLDRAWNSGVSKIIVTGTDLTESAKAIELTKSYDRLFSTVGCHPTNCNQIEEGGDSYLEKLTELYAKNKEKVVALGEFGLDFDRLHFCPKETQIRCFERQLIHFQNIKLPLFLHCRNAAAELVDVLSRNRGKFVGGVVHSFDGTLDQAKMFLDLGLFIGINGCSLKTEDNLKVVKELPNEKVLIETDSPWCEVRPTHAGYKFIDTKFDSVKKEKWDPNKMVKGRNEPCNIVQILEILSKVKEGDKFELGQMVLENTEKLFFASH